MTPTPHGQVPEALIYAELPDLDDTLWLAIGQHRRAITIVETSAAAKAVDAAVHSLLRAYADATHALRTAHVQNPAEIEHVVGDVSKNRAEVNTSQQPAPATQQAGWTNADADAARLALELECLLMDTKDAAVVSKWWASANDALEMHRARLQEVQPTPTAQAAESVPAMSDAARDLLAERARQVQEEGWTPEHDDEHSCGEMAEAAACYAASARVPTSTSGANG